MHRTNEQNWERMERKLQGKDRRGHVGTELVAAAAGVLLGVLVGFAAGVPGMIAGAVVGGIIGAIAGIGYERGIRTRDYFDREIDKIEHEAEEVIESRRSGAPPAPTTATDAHA